MTELDRVKRNVGKMIDQGATEPEINQYLFSEKVSPDQLRAAPAAEAPKAEEDPYRVAARAEMDKRKAAGVPSEAGLTRQIAHGATLGAADEILAGLNTPLEMISRGTFNPVEGYRYAKAREDLTMEDARANNGLLGAAAEVMGGIGSGAALARGGLTAGRMLAPNAGLGARSAASAADGVVMGAVAGGMEGNGEERLGNAVQGGLLGGIVSGAAPAALSVLGTAASPFISNYRAWKNPQGFANSQVARSVVESGKAPADIVNAVRQAADEGQGMFTLADAMGNPGQRMLSTVARAPGAGRTETVNFLESRQAGQGRRIANTLAEGFDSPRTAAQTEAALTTARDTASDVAYGAARRNAGAVDIQGAISNIDDTLRPGVNQIISQPSNIADDGIEATLRKYRGRMTDGNSVLSDYISVERLRKEIADEAQKAFQSGAGNKGSLLKGVVRQIDNAMEAASDGYKAANAQHTAGSRAIDAVDEGRSAAMRGRTEDIIPAFRAMPEPRQSAFRAGYVDPLIADVQGPASGVNKARPFTSDAFQDEAAAIAPMRTNPLMQRRIGRENTMFETRRQATGGSGTVENFADEAAMQIDPTFVNNIVSGNYMGALGSIIRAVNNGWGGNTAAVREQVARILLQRGQNIQPAAIQSTLDEAVRRIELMRNVALQLGRSARGGLAVAPAATDQR